MSLFLTSGLPLGGVKQGRDDGRRADADGIASAHQLRPAIIVLLVVVAHKFFLLSLANARLMKPIPVWEGAR